MDYKKYAEAMLSYIDASPCSFWACKNAVDILKSCGFTEYTGYMEKGGKYYITRGDTALCAFVNGEGALRLGMAHTDSPTFMLKPRCEIRNEGVYVRLNTELYGGAILSTWLDRPLGIAGRIIVKGKGLNTKTVLYKSDRPLCIIPNSPPHLNKDINRGYTYNKQQDMLPLFALGVGKSLIETICEDMAVDPKAVLDYDLYTYEYTKGVIFNDMLSVGRLDDLMMCYSLIRAVCEADTQNKAMVILTDNEEVGSLTMSGARGSFPLDCIRELLGEDYKKYLDGAMAISADLAHGVNPSHPEFHEPLSRPYLNRGMVLKRAANKSYSTDAVSGGLFKLLCERAEIEYQSFVNHSDRPGGTTIGPMISAALGIPVADVGAPILAMHSVRELGGVKDAGDSYMLFKALFEA